MSNAYTIFLNSSSIGAVDDVDEGKRFGQVIHHNLIHFLGLADARTVYNDDPIL